MLEALKPLEKGSGIEIEGKHVLNILKQFFQDDDATLDMINEGFIIGSNLYAMAIQFLAARAVFRNPEQYFKSPN